MARRLLSRQAAASERARICVAASSARSRSTRPSTAARSRKAGRHWEKTAPDGFQFAIKGSRFCVMPLEARRRRRGHRQFLRPGLCRAGSQARADPVAFSPRAGKFDRDDIAAFHRPAAREAGRHHAAPRDRAAARKLPRRELLRPLPRRATSPSCSRIRTNIRYRSRYRGLRLCAAAADERGHSDRL